MKRLLIVGLTLWVSLLWVQAEAQQKPDATRKPKQPTSVQAETQQKPDATATPLKQWEYLVVSFGKTTFSNPISDPELKQGGLSKILFYSNAGIVSASEAVTVQQQMDTLGHFGWELINIVGAIGGDQQMVFKRQFDTNRSEKEAALIKAEGERLAKAKQKAKAKLQEQKPPDELVDLDATERQAGIDAEAKLLSDGILAYKNLPIKIINVDASQTEDGKFKADVLVQVDGTTRLLHENKYRKSEAFALAREICDVVFMASKLKPGGGEYDEFVHIGGLVQIRIVVVITHAGEEKPIVMLPVGGNRPWSDGKKEHP